LPAGKCQRSACTNAGEPAGWVALVEPIDHLDTLYYAHLMDLERSASWGNGLGRRQEAAGSGGGEVMATVIGNENDNLLLGSTNADLIFGDPFTGGYPGPVDNGQVLDSGRGGGD
jgi:hypothetical protein